MGANALRILGYGANWDAMDGGTSGPLNSLVLCWPVLFGGDVTLSTVRLTAAILLSLSVILLYYTIKVTSGRLAAWLMLLPLTCFYALTEHPDFLHYSSEILPVTLLLLSVLMLAVYSRSAKAGGSLWFLFVGGIALSAAPLAKLQSVLLAALLFPFFIMEILLRAKQHKWKRLMLFLFACGLPVLWLLGPLLLRGGIEHFYRSYIEWPSVYVQQSLSLSTLYGMIARDGLSAALLYLYAGVLLAGLLAGWRKLFNWKHNGFLYFVLVAAGVSLYTVARPGNEFPHYLMFIFPFWALAAGIVCGFAEHAKWGRYMVCSVFAIILSIFFIYPAYAHLNAKVKGKSFYSTKVGVPFRWQSPRIFNWCTDPDDSLLVWGWMPQWYLLAGLSPATHESTTFLHIMPTPLQSFYRNRFMNTVQQSSPALIIDAVVGNSFYFFKNEEAGIHVFPELQMLVSSNYTQLIPSSGLVASNRPPVYLRNDRYAAFMEHLVPIALVTASATHVSVDDRFCVDNVNDYSVTEDAYVDYWLLPNDKTGTLVATFAEAAPVKRVIVLNTRNGMGLNRESKHISLTLLLDGKEVYDQELEPVSYPTWTIHELNAPVMADALRVGVLDYAGRGGGLNEIKVFRD